MDTFREWLLEKMENRDWMQADLARKANISRGTVANLLRGVRKPGVNVCTAIAKAFDLPPDAVFRKAGLLPGKNTSNGEEQIETLRYIASQLPEWSVKELVLLTRARLQMERKNES